MSDYSNKEYADACVAKYHELVNFDESDPSNPPGRKEYLLEEVAKDPLSSLMYARYHLKGRFEQGEAVIAKHDWCALEYVQYVTHAPFPEAESLFAQYSDAACQYARFIGQPFPLGEKAIAEDGQQSLDYAISVLQGPFPLGEKAIAEIPSRLNEYILYALIGDSVDLEDITTKLTELKSRMNKYESRTNIFAHEIKYRFWDENISFDNDEIIELLDQYVEEHVTGLIRQGYIEGELLYFIRGKEFKGYWEIDRD